MNYRVILDICGFDSNEQFDAWSNLDTPADVTTHGARDNEERWTVWAESEEAARAIVTAAIGEFPVSIASVEAMVIDPDAQCREHGVSRATCDASH